MPKSKKRKKKGKVIDVSKLRKPRQVTVELTYNGQDYAAVLDVPPGSTDVEVAQAEANLRVMLVRQIEEAMAKRSKWLRVRRWFLDLFKRS